MKKFTIVLFSFFLFSLIPAQYIQAQGTVKDYQNAEKFLYCNVLKLVKNWNLRPNWINKSDMFWYRTQTKNGYNFIKVNPRTGKSSGAFNQQKLAKALSTVLKKSINPDSLPVKELKFSKDQKFITFNIDSTGYKYVLKTDQLSKVKTKPKLKKNESKSPDGKWIVFLKDYNLFLRSTETGKVTRLTKDGIRNYDYANQKSWYKLRDESKGYVYNPHINITWSKDSKSFVTFKEDNRGVGRLYLYQTMPDSGLRAKIWSYERALPGEKAPTRKYYIFNIQNKTEVPIHVNPVAIFCEDISPTWTKDGKHIFFSRFSRGYKSYNLFFADPKTGNARIAIHQTENPMIELQMKFTRVIDTGKQIIVSSEQSGWNQLYLFNGQTGKLINRITHGQYVVRGIKYVDQKKHVIYFTAGGKQPGVDPYFKFLYRIDFNGHNLKCLTPEDADHQITMSPHGEYFIDNYSRVNLPTVSVLRRSSDGKLIKVLQKADISKLLATGWRHPQPFKAKARDGKTNIYGVIFFPSTFNPHIKYPILDDTYSGPQAVNTPKNFIGGIWNDAQSLAEVGFIVIKVDGLGTAMRSKKFHDFSYHNLGDIGSPDHIAAIKQLAGKYHFLDTTRVGIFGYSAGGYDAVHAMLMHPEFYKVAVAGSGNQDQRMAKAWWPEQYMGMPYGFNGKVMPAKERWPHPFRETPHDYYIDQSNITLANRLQGKLLLCCGDMDNNVNPECTLRLADQLIKDNKDFQMLIFPNMNHEKLWGNLYFIRKRMDFFVKNLWDITPPKEFKFTKLK